MRFKNRKNVNLELVDKIDRIEPARDEDDKKLIMFAVSSIYLIIYLGYTCGIRLL